MRHHAGQFGFLVGGENQPAVDVEKPAGQRERVDFVGINHLDRERNLGVGVPHQVLPDAIHVLIDDRVLHQAGGLLHHHGVLLAHLDFGLGRVPVAQAASANVPVADGIHVVLTATLHTRRRGAGGIGACLRRICTRRNRRDDLVIVRTCWCRGLLIVGGRRGGGRRARDCLRIRLGRCRNSQAETQRPCDQYRTKRCLHGKLHPPSAGSARTLIHPPSASTRDPKSVAGALICGHYMPNCNVSTRRTSRHTTSPHP